MSKVAIVGYGYVGKGMHKIFPDAWIYDPGIKRNSCLSVQTLDGEIFDYAKHDPTKEDINKNCSLAIVCVPTPPIGMDEQRVDDDCDTFLQADTSIVEEVVSWLKTPLILIKSTVPPFTTDYFKNKYHKRICFSPEYMGEGGYYIPPQYPDPVDPVKHGWMIIGGEDRDCDDIYDIFIQRMGASKVYFKCSTIEAELIKHMENTWIATKVTFANEWKNICDSFNVSYNTVREGWLLDPRVERAHTAVFKDKPGFGGKCLPKDLHSIITASEKQGYGADLLKSVWGVNQKIRGIKK